MIPMPIIRFSCWIFGGSTARPGNDSQSLIWGNVLRYIATSGSSQTRLVLFSPQSTKHPKMFLRTMNTNLCLLWTFGHSWLFSISSNPGDKTDGEHAWSQLRSEIQVAILTHPFNAHLSEENVANVNDDLISSHSHYKITHSCPFTESTFVQTLKLLRLWCKAVVIVEYSRGKRAATELTYLQRLSRCVWFKYLSQFRFDTQMSRSFLLNQKSMQESSTFFPALWTVFIFITAWTRNNGTFCLVWCLADWVAPGHLTGLVNTEAATQDHHRLSRDLYVFSLLQSGAFPGAVHEAELLEVHTSYSASKHDFLEDPKLKLVHSDQRFVHEEGRQVFTFAQSH